MVRRNTVQTMISGAIAVGLLGTTPAPSHAVERFGTDGIWFEVDTVMEFEFVESNGSYQSTFGILNLDTGDRFPLYTEVKPSDVPQPITVPSDYQNDAGLQNQDDFQGTPGNTVPQFLGEFTFNANTNYTFYLESYYNGQPAGTLYSTSAQNFGNRQYAEFTAPIDNLMNGGILLNWEDTGSVLVELSDNDYDDFIVRMGGYLVWDRPGDGCYPAVGNSIGGICVPEPTVVTNSVESEDFR